jgi:hypothetical protein
VVNKNPKSKTNPALFRLYDLLDRYEELIEDMSELGVASVSDAEAKIGELNAQIDELEADDDDRP